MLESKATELKQDILRGRSASKGVAKGISCVLDLAAEEHALQMQPASLGADLAAFDEALQRTIEQIQALQVMTSEKLADVAVLIFSAHLLILEDDQFTGRIRELISEGESALHAIHVVVDEYVEIFFYELGSDDSRKVLDVKDLGNRLGRNLCSEEEFSSDYGGQIIAVRELLPSDILKFSAEQVEGLIICSGVTSHNAIICRSLGIPMVAISRDAFDLIPDGVPILMDAAQGIIYIKPSDEIIAKYQELEQTWRVLNDASDVQEVRRTAWVKWSRLWRT